MCPANISYCVISEGATPASAIAALAMSSGMIETMRAVPTPSGMAPAS